MATKAVEKADLCHKILDMEEKLEEVCNVPDELEELHKSNTPSDEGEAAGMLTSMH